MKVTEGFMPFRGLRTYYRICGDLHNGKTPLLLLHGGPGSTHQYFEMLDPLAELGRPVVMYDQIGCGKSPAPGRKDLFCMDIWMEELIALREHLGLEQVFILGQSWGGMLLLEYLCHRKPEGISGAVLASTLPSSRLWAEEQHRMILDLPEDMRKAIAEAEASGLYEGDAYAAANAEFMARHCAPVWGDGAPDCLTRKKNAGTEAYLTAWGPNEFTPLGNLKDFDVRDSLKDIHVPVLITSGVFDLCTPRIASVMQEGITGAEWVLFEKSRHMAFAEENERYLSVLEAWLEKHDMN